MPVVEIANWTLSNAYFADPEIINRGIEFLKNVEGCRSIHWGIAEEDKKSFFLLVVWETLEHHMALTNRAGYPEFIGFGPAIEGNASIKHVELCKKFEHSLSAPLTEFLLLTLEEGKTGEDLDRPLQTLAEGIDKVNPKYAPAAWGVTFESSREYYVLAAWESSEAHLDAVKDVAVMSYISAVRAIARPRLLLANLKEVHRASPGL